MSQKIPKTAVGTAHSKLILIGEHAVVYGQPAIALPFSLVGVTATVWRHEKFETILIESPYHTGSISDLPPEMTGIAACIQETLKVLNEPQTGLKIRIQSSIPIGRGLGSSAALAIAIVRSLFTYFKHPCDHGKLMELVHIAEKHAHGNPSGIDMAAASSDQPIWFQKGERIRTVTITKKFSLIIADSGRIGDTRAAVEGIRHKYEADPDLVNRSIQLLGDYTRQAKEALKKGQIETLGQTLNAAQHELCQLGVSDEGLDRLVEAARNAGALGAKLTGGGRGGCIIALAEEEQLQKIADALVQAGAYQTWTVQIGEIE